jgi:2-polyprenyl-3-methyl-5-hydroxy-6-metoxy-1,4-benzoquinol methylase
MKKKNFAFETYKNVEAVSNFASLKDRRSYADALLAKTYKNELPFLRKHIPQVDSVIEIGSGSGRILHSLLREGRVKEARGIELSPSRVRFGKWWAQEGGYSGVGHEVGDALAMSIKGQYDVVLCMTSIFPFFDMLKPNGFRTILRKIKKMLKPGGYLVLETVTFAHEVAHCRVEGGVARLWEEYGKGDPFRFNLIEYMWEEKKRHLTAHSYNVMRDRLFVDGPSTKKWHVMTGKALVALLREESFDRVQLFGDFDSSRYKEGESFRQIAVARL